MYVLFAGGLFGDVVVLPSSPETCILRRDRQGGRLLEERITNRRPGVENSLVLAVEVPVEGGFGGLKVGPDPTIPCLVLQQLYLEEASSPPCCGAAGTL